MSTNVTPPPDGEPTAAEATPPTSAAPPPSPPAPEAPTAAVPTEAPTSAVPPPPPVAEAPTSAVPPAPPPPPPAPPVAEAPTSAAPPPPVPPTAPPVPPPTAPPVAPPAAPPGATYAYVQPVGYVDPYAKSKVVAGILGLLVGGFGVHRFYLGFTTIGIIQIIVTLATCGIGAIWGVVEGILILVGASGFTTDADGRPLRD